MIKYIVIVSCLTIFSGFDLMAQTTHSLSVEIQLPDNETADIESKGRLFLFVSESPRGEPRFQLWPSPASTTHIYARNLTGMKAGDRIQVNEGKEFSSNSELSLEQLPEGRYFLQALWDQDTIGSGINSFGNYYSQATEIVLEADTLISLTMDQAVSQAEEPEHPLLRWVSFRSDTLSSWWSRETMLKAAVLLPADYKEGKSYPIRYNIAGYGGRYTRVRRLLSDLEFMDWWQSGEAPEIINVFLDGEGPFGDSYQLDSENSGPYGTALINELIPYIENTFRGTNEARTRFLDGCSTGGWVSLALQMFYPDHFNGTFSYSPDAVEFENYQLINIYRDDNAFVNEFGVERPVWRQVSGEPVMTLRDFIDFENILGRSDNYLTSGGQFSAHTALYSPKGENGLPKALFDPVTGVIDHEVADHWKKYDMKIYASENWTELGPKLQGKLYIWMGDMDNFYLNPATRALYDFLQSAENPASDAVIEFSAMEGHCSQFSHRRVLEQIQQRLDYLEK